MQTAFKDKPLTEDEISALVAFLEKAGGEQGNQRVKNYQSTMLLVGAAGLLGLLGFYGIFWFNRKRRSVNKSVYDRQKDSKK